MKILLCSVNFEIQRDMLERIAKTSEGRARPMSGRPVEGDAVPSKLLRIVVGQEVGNSVQLSGGSL